MLLKYSNAAALVAATLFSSYFVPLAEGPTCLAHCRKNRFQGSYQNRTLVPVWNIEFYDSALLSDSSPLDGAADNVNKQTESFHHEKCSVDSHQVRSE